MKTMYSEVGKSSELNDAGDIVYHYYYEIGHASDRFSSPEAICEDIDMVIDELLKIKKDLKSNEWGNALAA